VATPYGPTTTRPAPPVIRERRRPSVVGPLVLISVGAVFLLENAGLLPANTWQSLWRLWPVVLVLVGLELLVGQRIPWVTLLGISLVVLALGIGATSYSSARTEPIELRGRTIDTNLEGASQAAVTVRFGAGELRIAPMVGAAQGQLASMTYAGGEAESLRPSYSVSGGIARLEYRLDGWRGGQSFGPFFGSNVDHNRMQVLLNPAVPITALTVQGGASTAELDLRDLRIENLDMAIGAATTQVRLPRSGRTDVHISGGAATLGIEVPDGVSARVTHKGGLSTLEVDEDRFPSVGNNRYQSPDFETANNRVDITIESGLTTVEVR
jgi:hypothetical protein